MKNIIQDVIKELIIKDVNVDESLISSGLLDSHSIVVLLLELEERFNISIPLETLKPENFETINNIMQLIINID